MSVLLEGHSTVVFGDSVYIFGGKDNVTGFLLNSLFTAKLADFVSPESSVVPLQRVMCTGAIPSPRCYHAATLRGQFLVVFGGEETSSVASASSEHPQDMTLYSLNLVSFVWARYYIPGDRPSSVPRGRCHATLTSTPQSLLLYGGFPVGDGAVPEPNHWCVFEIREDAVVRAVAVKGNAPTLWGHSAVYVHKCLMVFGGIDGSALIELSSMCVFHGEERRWRWADFPLSPEPRALHTAVVDGSRMYVFGGFSSRADHRDFPHLCDVWSFSLNTGMWEQILCTGDVPPARSGHSSFIFDHKMFVVGGLEGNALQLAEHGTVGILDLQSNEWTTKQLEFGAEYVPSQLPLPSSSTHQPLNDDAATSRVGATLFPASSVDVAALGIALPPHTEDGISFATEPPKASSTSPPRRRSPQPQQGSPSTAVPPALLRNGNARGDATQYLSRASIPPAKFSRQTPTSGGRNTDDVRGVVSAVASLDKQTSQQKILDREMVAQTREMLSAEYGPTPPLDGTSFDDWQRTIRVAAANQEEPGREFPGRELRNAAGASSEVPPESQYFPPAAAASRGKQTRNCLTPQGGSPPQNSAAEKSNVPRRESTCAICSSSQHEREYERSRYVCAEVASDHRTRQSGSQRRRSATSKREPGSCVGATRTSCIPCAIPARTGTCAKCDAVATRQR